jgi:DNA-directed RNA polymerase subunit M/transcription elongation factor TFIIS
MPTYVGKKALKQQRKYAQRLCLYHPTWTPLFFKSSLTVVQEWLSVENQPLLQRFSREEIEAMDEMIIPTQREELEEEYSKLMCQQEIYFYELTDPTYPRISEHAPLASKFQLATVMTTRKRNQMMMLKYMCEPDLPLADPDCLFPLCPYGQLIKFAGEQRLYLSTHDRRLLPRPLLLFLQLQDERRLFVQRIESLFSGLLLPSMDATILRRRKEDILELERHVCSSAWDRMREQFPNYSEINNFMEFYEQVKFEILSLGHSNSPHRQTMFEEWMVQLFVLHDYPLLVSNRYETLNANMWVEVAHRVNAKLDTIALEPNCDYYFCPKCKSNRCLVIAKQVRSGDEPVTIFAFCLSCGNDFKPKN